MASGHSFQKHKSGKRWKSRMHSTRGGLRFPDIHLPAFSGIDGFEWYDYLMIGILLILGIYIATHFQQVISLFLAFTILVINISLVLLLLLVILLIIWLVLRSKRS